MTELRPQSDVLPRARISASHAFHSTAPDLHRGARCKMAMKLAYWDIRGVGIFVKGFAGG